MIQITMLSRIFSPAVARTLFISISAIALGYHGLILSGVVDFRYAWGGRIPDHRTMIQMESVSVVIQLLLVAIVLYSTRVVKRGPRIVLGVAFMAMGVLFLFNTAGNLAAVTAFERYAFTPLTLLAALCAFRMGLPMFRNKT